ncbi:MAG: trigger factor [Acutalibacteraceae bacterium]|nr:trigger factor [Acutalibacteraceae bacterium]
MSLKSSNKVDTNRYELLVEIDAETFEKAVNTAFKKNVKKLNVPGFRKGKAPRGIVEKMYGENVFYEEALNECYPEAIDGAAKEAGVEIVDFQDVEFDLKNIGKEGVEFSVKVTVKPEVSVKDYKGLKAEKPSTEVTEEDINADIARLRERASTMVPVEDRVAENDDVVVFDFDGYVDGEQFEGGKAEDYSLKLGSGQFIPGFEDQIVGKKIDEEFDVNVTFPEDYHVEELKGKEAVFKCKLHEIKTRVLPEVDDEFAKDVSEFETLDELKEDLKKKAAERKEKDAETQVQTQLIEGMLEGFEAEIPQAMIDSKIMENIRDFDYTLQMQGLNMQQYMQYMGMTLDNLKEQYKEQSEKQVKMRLAFEKIAELESLEPTAEEIEDQYKEYAEMYQMDVEKIKASIPETELVKDLKVKKASEFIKDNAKITEEVKA